MGIGNNISHPVDVHVGIRLKKKRLEYGITQEELGKAVKITFQQVQKYEKGTNRISCSRLYEFAHFLHVGISYFFAGFQQDDSQSDQNYTYTIDQLHDMALADSVDDDTYEAEITPEEIQTLLSSYHMIRSQKVRNNMLSLIKSLAHKNL